MKCSQEVRAVERRVLLETLAGELPLNTIQYSSQLARIEATPNGDTLLELVDGSKLLAKVSHGDITITKFLAAGIIHHHMFS